MSLLIARTALSNAGDASAHTITGVRTLDRANGGALVVPAGSAYPGSPAAGELFWRSDVGILYRRNSGNTAWEAIPVTATHANEKHDPDMLTVGDSRSDTNLDMLLDGDQDPESDALHLHVKRDKSRAYLWDDFVGKQLEDAIWYADTTAGSVGIVSSQGGAVRLQSNSVGNNYCRLWAAYSPAGQCKTSNFTLEARLKLAQTGTASKTTLGVMTVPIPPTEQIAFNNLSGTWQARIVVASVANNYDTGVAIDTSWHIMRIESVPGSVKFYIDGVLEIERTTGLPDVDAAFPGIEQLTVSSGSANTCYFDWLEMTMVRD